MLICAFLSICLTMAAIEYEIVAAMNKRNV